MSTAQQNSKESSPKRKQTKPDETAVSAQIILIDFVIKPICSVYSKKFVFIIYQASFSHSKKDKEIKEEAGAEKTTKAVTLLAVKTSAPKALTKSKIPVFELTKTSQTDVINFNVYKFYKMFTCD